MKKQKLKIISIRATNSEWITIKRQAKKGRITVSKHCHALIFKHKK